MHGYGRGMEKVDGSSALKLFSKAWGSDLKYSRHLFIPKEQGVVPLGVSGCHTLKQQLLWLWRPGEREGSVLWTCSMASLLALFFSDCGARSLLNWASPQSELSPSASVSCNYLPGNHEVTRSVVTSQILDASLLSVITTFHQDFTIQWYLFWLAVIISIQGESRNSESIVGYRRKSKNNTVIPANAQALDNLSLLIQRPLRWP